MNLANNEGDYSDIKNFYRYKICDSIIELDINDTVRKYNKQHRADPSGTYESHGSLTKKLLRQYLKIKSSLSFHKKSTVVVDFYVFNR